MANHSVSVYKSPHIPVPPWSSGQHACLPFCKPRFESWPRQSACTSPRKVNCGNLGYPTGLRPRVMGTYHKLKGSEMSTTAMHSYSVCTNLYLPPLITLETIHSQSNGNELQFILLAIHVAKLKKTHINQKKGQHSAPTPAPPCPLAKTTCQINLN